MMMMRFVAIGAVLAASMAIAAPVCSSLSGLVIPDTTVLSAGEISAGAFQPSGSTRAVSVPDFCRVTAIARPANDSEIHFEVRLPPMALWNGKFEGTGNGGFSGVLSYATMAVALRRGYATAGSDTGHDADDLTFGVGHPDRIKRNRPGLSDRKLDFSRVRSYSHVATGAESKACYPRHDSRVVYTIWATGCPDALRPAYYLLMSHLRNTLGSAEPTGR